MVEELLASGRTLAVVLSGQAGPGAGEPASSCRQRHPASPESQEPGRTAPSRSSTWARRCPARTCLQAPRLCWSSCRRPLSPGTAGIPADAYWAGFRDVAAGLNPTETALFVEASAIANWHAMHTHCPRCGAPTVVEAGGWVRRCPKDGFGALSPDRSRHHRHRGGTGRPAPAGRRRARWTQRTTQRSRVLLNRASRLEQAVVREIREEVGVQGHRVPIPRLAVLAVPRLAYAWIYRQSPLMPKQRPTA